MSQLHVTDKLIETAALMVAGYSIRQIGERQGVRKGTAQKRCDKVRLWFKGETAQESGGRLIREHFSNQVIRVTRMDDGTEVESRPMTSQERQMGMKFPDDKKDKA